MKILFIKFIRAYQYLISPFLGNRCRFYPSCSEYMQQAIMQYGVFKGLRLGFKRLSRCHPLSPGGVDPIPEPEECKHSKKP